MTIKEHIQALIDCNFCDTLPEALPVGYFTNNKTIVFPDFQGRQTKNICIIENESNRNSICHQLEYIAFSLLSQLSPDLIKLTIVDLGQTISLKNLNQISNIFDNIQILRNFKEVENLTIKLEERTKEIQGKYLTNLYDDINEYNSNTTFNKTFFEFIIYVDFPKGIETVTLFNSFKNLIELQSHCGIIFYTIFNHVNISANLKENLERKGLDFVDEFETLLSKMITIDESNYGNTLIQLRLSNLNRNNSAFSFFPYQQLNFNKLIELVKLKYESEIENTNLNFVEIPIGLEGNNEISIKLGDKSNITGVAICGSKGSGKSTFLTNFVSKVIFKYNSNEVRFIILDYTDNEEYEIFENSPNIELLSFNKKQWKVGFDKMKELVENAIIERVDLFKKASILSEKKINNLSDYFWATNEKIPVYIILVDEGAKLIQRGEKAISEEAPKIVNSYFAKVLEEYRKFGIYLVFATQSYSKISFDALSQIDLRIGFNVATNSDCSDLFKHKKPVGLEKYHALYNDNYGNDEDYNLTKKVKMYPLMSNLQTELSKNASKNSPSKFEKIILRDSFTNEQTEPSENTIQKGNIQKRFDSLKSITLK